MERTFEQKITGANSGIRKEYLILSAILALSVFPRLYFFRAELWAWDSGEFASAVRDLILPHAPYPGYLAIGLLSKHLSPFPIDLTLSLLSFIFGTLVIIPFYSMAKSILKDREMTLTAVFFFAFAPSLINQSGYQEIYSPQCFLVMLTAALLLNGKKQAFWLAALAYGASLTVNIIDIFFIPFIIYFAVKNGVRFPKMLVWFFIAFSVEAAAVFWTYIVLGSFDETFKYWFYDMLKVLADPAKKGGMSVSALAAMIFNLDWLIDKISSFLKSLFSSITPVLSVAWFAGLYFFRKTERNGAGLLLAFSLPYFIFDFFFPLRASGLHITFFLPAAAICGASLLCNMLEAGQGIRRAVPIALTAVLFVSQSASSPILPNEQSGESFLYNMHGFFKWIGESTAKNSVVVTEREPWIVMYYADRAVIYSSFSDDWTEKMSLFYKSPGMRSANGHKTVSVETIAEYLREGVPVYTTTMAPFADFVPAGNKGEVLLADNRGISRDDNSTPLFRLVLNKLYLDETYFPVEYSEKAFNAENLSHDPQGGFIYPSSAGTPAIICYRFEPKGSESLNLKARFYLLGEKNRAGIYISRDGFDYESLYEAMGDAAGRFEEPEIDLSTRIKDGGSFFIKMLLYRDGDEPGPLIDSRLERLMVYEKNSGAGESL